LKKLIPYINITALVRANTRRGICLTITSLLILLSSTAPIAAQTSPQAERTIEKYIEQKKFVEAEKMFQTNVSYYLSKKIIDSLVDYPKLKGKLVSAVKGDGEVSKAIYDYINLLEDSGATAAQLRKAYRSAGRYFYAVYRYREAYRTAQVQLEYAERIKPLSNTSITDALYYLGFFASRLDDVTKALEYYRRAYYIKLRDKNTSPSEMYESLTSMAQMMLSISKSDSAMMFYKQALEVLPKMPSSSLNKYSKPGTIHKNIAIICDMEGKSAEAIDHSYKAIQLYRQYLKSDITQEELPGTRTDLCRAIENLSIYYSHLGNLTRANDLLRYSYTIKKGTLNDRDPELMKTEGLLGSNYNNLGDYEHARHYLNTAINRAKHMDSPPLFPLADAWYVLASVNTNTNKIEKATRCFAVADSLYGLAYQGFYDDMYLDYLRNSSMFYAKNGETQKAIKRANQVYKYLQSQGQGESLQAFYQLLNIAKVNYYTGRYTEAIKYSDLALATINKKLKNGKYKLDSIKLEMYKPQAIRVNVMATYQMKRDKDVAFLTGILNRVDEALLLMERSKGIADGAENTNFIVETNRELLDFAKKVNLELYELTGKATHIEQMMNLHESGLYNRIRSRLDNEQATRFAFVPQHVIAEESRLKKSINTALTPEAQSPDLIRDYLQAVKRWENHLEMVRTKYPEYYRLRYATIFKTLPDLQSSIPEHTTLVRYYFMDETLVALVADKHRKTIIRLSAEGLDKKIGEFLEHRLREEDQLALLHGLYKQLWAPLAGVIKTQKVLIVPDGVLYNLGYDMLPVQPVTKYKQLKEKSLLAKHAISYHYSLFMLDAQHRENKSSDNYVAFAPGFSDELKSCYKGRIKDSLNLDLNYLTLLPQPGSNSLAKKIRSLIGGDIYLDAASTTSAFRRYAGNHKVIHIATHAEYNNVYPEKSGLIFAKAGGGESNRINLVDIYNCDLSSDLTILTACESGRPGYQDGEGMVSLAHAFNYAGSKNILTALWKIDEQSSSRITEKFLEYVKQGMSTDEALRQAKLDYLGEAEGRLADPGYWAGLALMGVPRELELRNSTPSTWIAAAGTLLIPVVVVVFMRRRTSRKAV